MFDELQDLFRGLITTAVANVQMSREQHKDALAHTEVAEGLRRAELALHERGTVARERSAAAWERVASALERLADKA